MKPFASLVPGWIELLVRRAATLLIGGGVGVLLAGLGTVPLWALPTLVRSPAGLSVSVGDTARFEVVADTDRPPLSYQWQWFGTNLPGRTAASLVLDKVGPAQAGPYGVLLSDPDGSVASATAWLDVDLTFFKVTEGDLVTGSTQAYGVNWVDYNQDDLVDLVISCGFGGTAMPMLVYDNLGGGQMRRNRTNELAQLTVRGGTMVWADYDNDGDPDVYVTHRESRAEFYLRNEGQGRFTSQPVAGGVTTGDGWAAASVDYDQDGWLDLLVGKWGSASMVNNLFRNRGDGTFQLAAGSGLDLPTIWTESLAWVDYDEDGDWDVLVTTSGPGARPDLLMVNNGNGVFTNLATHRLVVQSSAVTAGQAWADYDNDGDLDLAICRWEAGHPLLYRSLGGGRYDVPPASPVAGAGWSSAVPQWADYDNDGHLDLFVSPAIDGTNLLPRLFHNRGDGTFTEVLTGSPVRDPGYYGCGWGDYDGDGFVDLLMPDGRSGTNNVYRNNLPATGNTNQWLKVALTGRVSNRSAIGATIRVRTTMGGRVTWQRRQITGQTFDNTLEAHFGLGNATSAEVLRVEWPSGIVQEIGPVAAGQKVRVTEQGAAFSLQPMDLAARPGGGITNRVRFVSTGGEAISYQWYHNGLALADETGVTLIRTNLQAAALGEYTVVASFGTATATSRVARLEMLIDPVITLAPVSQAVVPGGQVTFSVGYTGSPMPFSVEWRKGSTTYVTNTVYGYEDFFCLSNVQTADFATWRVVVLNAAKNFPTVNQNTRTFTLTAALDADADGLPDDWEVAYGFPTNSADHAVLDPDADGVTTRGEYRSGTDPLDARSYLRVDLIEAANPGCATRLTFLAASNQTYSVLGRAVVDPGEWIRVADVAATPTNRVAVVEVQCAGPRQYYRLVTPRSP